MLRWEPIISFVLKPQVINFSCSEKAGDDSFADLPNHNVNPEK